MSFVVALFALTLQADSTLLLKPDSAEMNQHAPAVCHVRLQTTKGDVRMEMRREWAPNGVDRFYNLVRHGYYDQSAVFRIRTGMWAQFGINGDPRISQLWRMRTIPDDPRKESNLRGTVAFAFKAQTVVARKCLSICATTLQRTTKNHLFQSPKLLQEWMSSIRCTQGTAKPPAVEFEAVNKIFSLRGAMRT